MRVLSVVPTYLCLLFIVIRFAVLLCLDVQKKWFQSSSNVNVGDLMHVGGDDWKLCGFVQGFLAFVVIICSEIYCFLA